MRNPEHLACRKLLATLHLSVPERRSLPLGVARMSVLVTVVSDELNRTGWFPRKPSSDCPIGDGAVIEAVGNAVRVHEQHEIGVMRFGSVRVRVVADVREAVEAYLVANGGDPVDGVSVALDL